MGGRLVVRLAGDFGCGYASNAYGYVGLRTLCALLWCGVQRILRRVAVAVLQPVSNVVV